MSPTGLDALFEPRSIAVVGASSNPEKISGMPLAFLKRHGFDGALYPVNPGAGEIQGLRAYPSLGAIDDTVDLAICAVGADRVDAAIDDAARAGVRAMVMFSSGFAETGEAGRQAQQRVLQRCRHAGIRLLGPNCLGFMNVRSNVYATFSPALSSGVPQPGPIAIVSQSGAFGMFALVRARERGLGIGWFVSTGNEADVDFADCVAHFADDPSVGVILGYLEGARDGERLVAAFEAARRQRKPVVVCKAGASAIGADAAASHTASLAGSDAVYDAIFRQCGVWRAHTIDELFDVGYAAAAGRFPNGRRLGVISISGGAGVTIADAAEEHGMQLPPLGRDARDAILARVPFAGAANPVDITGQVMNDLPLLGDACEWMLRDGTYDALISFQAVTGITPHHRDLLAPTWRRIRERHPELPVAVVTVFDEQNRRELEALGCLAMDEPSRAVRSLAALAWIREQFDRPAASPASATAARSTPPPVVATEPQALAELAAAGMPVIEHRVVTCAEDAARVALQWNVPLAMKIVSPDIAHKSDAGGVALGVGSPDAARAAYARIVAAVSTAAPDAAIDGVLVAPMVRGGVECILGVQVDPVFGPVVMFGLGGVLVEVIGDVSFRRAPFDRDEARRMIDEVRGRRVLDGVRGAPAADVDALAAALVTLSRYAAANADWLESIDVNPFIVRAHGEGAVAVDALIRPASSAAGEVPGHGAT